MQLNVPCQGCLNPPAPLALRKWSGCRTFCMSNAPPCPAAADAANMRHEGTFCKTDGPPVQVHVCSSLRLCDKGDAKGAAAQQLLNGRCSARPHRSCCNVMWHFTRFMSDSSPVTMEQGLPQGCSPAAAAEIGRSGSLYQSRSMSANSSGSMARGWPVACREGCAAGSGRQDPREAS